MRRSVVILCVLAVGYAAGRSRQDTPAYAGPVECSSGASNGNVNGDANTDISDIIYLLNFLFRGGPAACDNRADLEVELARCQEELQACRESLAACEGEPELKWYTTCASPAPPPVYWGEFKGRFI